MGNCEPLIVSGAVFSVLICFFVGAVSGIKVGEASAADWLGAVSEAWTFVVALLAYVYWRRPDDAKRRADAAQELIRLCGRYEAAALAARVPLAKAFGREPTNAEKLEVLKVALAWSDIGKIKEARALGYELHSMEPEVAQMFGAAIAAKVESLFKIFERADTAYFKARFYPDDVAHLTEEQIRDLPNLMRDLGVRAGIAWTSDEIEPQLKNEKKALAADLMPFIVASAQILT